MVRRITTQLNLHYNILSRGILAFNSLISPLLLACSVSFQFFSAESAQPPDTLPELNPKQHPSSLLSCPPHLTTSPLHLISRPYSNSLFHLSFLFLYHIPDPTGPSFLSFTLTFYSKPDSPLPRSSFSFPPLHTFTLGER